MIDFKKKILDTVKKSPRKLVLPEGRDVRVLKAAEREWTAWVSTGGAQTGPPVAGT